MSSKDQTISKANYGFLNSPKNRTNLAILSKEHAQDSEFCSFFGRIEETKIYFRDLLTFNIKLLRSLPMKLGMDTKDTE